MNSVGFWVRRDEISHSNEKNHQGAIDLVRTQAGGKGGQAIVINFITELRERGDKKGQKMRAY